MDNDSLETDCGIVTVDGYSICRAPRYQKEQQWEADARLIAKAPEMYELLKMVSGDGYRRTGRMEEVNKLLKEIDNGTG